MNISHHSILKKLEDELVKAKSAEKSSTIREHIHSMKALCELLLEVQQGDFQTPSAPQPSKMMMPQHQQPVAQPQLSVKEERLETEDGANGDSLFDF